MSITQIADLTQQHADAKAAAAEARTQHGKDSAEAKEAKKAVDRLYQALRRARNANDQEAPVATATAEKPKTAAKPKGTAKKSGKAAKAKTKTAAKARKAIRKLEDFATPFAAGKVAEPNATPKVLDRTEKGNKVRACRKNRETGTHITLIDARLDRRFDADNGRWVTLEEESGIAAQHPTWEGACFFARIPSTWSSHSAKLVGE